MVEREAHNLQVAGSIPASATNNLILAADWDLGLNAEVGCR